MRMRLHIFAAIALTSLILSATNSHANITYSGPINTSFTDSFELDIDGDSNFDITFNFVHTTFGNPSVYELQASYNSSQLRIIGWSFPYSGGVLALDAGTAIGADLDPSLNWDPGFAHTMATRDYYILVPTNVISGAWADVANMYLGFELTGASTTNYGWVQMSVEDQVTSATVHDFAFESISGDSIMAGAIPEPSTLCLIFSGMLVIRFRKKRTTTGSTLRAASGATVTHDVLPKRIYPHMHLQDRLNIITL
jgi:hypothetical protein